MLSEALFSELEDRLMVELRLDVASISVTCSSIYTAMEKRLGFAASSGVTEPFLPEVSLNTEDSSVRVEAGGGIWIQPVYSKLVRTR